MLIRQLPCSHWPFSDSSMTSAWSMAASACSNILAASLSSSARYRSWALLLNIFALHVLLLGPGPATPQDTTGFLSIDCGLDSKNSNVDSTSTGIEWLPDSNLIQEGTLLQAPGGTDSVMGTLRWFDGNQNKYCYSLTSSADVKAGAFFLLRASFWAGYPNPAPFPPRYYADGYLNFTLIVDGEVWVEDVAIPYYNSTTPVVHEIYMRAQRDTVHVCLARSRPDGDAPFINALELRPLPSTLTSTTFMKKNNLTMVSKGRYDFGVLASNGHPNVRYPDDPLDRIWKAYVVADAKDVAVKTDAKDVNTTQATIDTSRQEDEPPPQIFQTALTASGRNYLHMSFSDAAPNSVYYFVELYFAETDPNVTASGLRVFKIVDAKGDGISNSNVVSTSQNGDDQQGNIIDVFARVGANAALGYAYYTLLDASDQQAAAGNLTFSLLATPESIYPPYLAAAELFGARVFTPLSSDSTVRAVEDIKTSLTGLTSYTGDPCLPTGFQYNWLNCSGAIVTRLSLSNYRTGGTISAAVNNLTSLIEISMDGNNLHGEIPNLSALTSLEILNLSNNGLNGSFPRFLATLKNLKVLNLQNNNLSGEIPTALLQRKQDSTLNFEFSGNPLLYCESNIGVLCSSGNKSSSSNKKKTNFGVIIGATSVGILVVSLGIGIAVYCMCYRNKHKSLEKQEFTKRRQSSVNIQKSLYEFTFEEIKDVTSSFSTQIGKGGFGPVYKGSLKDGRLVAVKVSSNASSQGSKEFVNEVELLSRIHHKNLVNFLGYCNQENMALVYEFMSNGSLYDHLHGPYATTSPLSWTTRLGIIVDATQGLDYLHYGCNPRIIHRDIKSSNILLNDHLQAKISDFGLSQNTLMDESGAPLTNLMGTSGYIDPEYVLSFNLTEKVDVYSFGVLLFEIVCGRKPVFLNSFYEQISLVEWVQSFIERGMIEDIVDASLRGKYDTLSMWKVLEVAVACVQFSSLQRPRMNVVFQELKEAQRMQLERINDLDTPLEDFMSGSDPDTFPYSHVSVR